MIHLSFLASVTRSVLILSKAFACFFFFFLSFFSNYEDKNKISENDSNEQDYLWILDREVNRRGIYLNLLNEPIITKYLSSNLSFEHCTTLGRKIFRTGLINERRKETNDLPNDRTALILEIKLDSARAVFRFGSQWEYRDVTNLGLSLKV